MLIYENAIIFTIPLKVLIYHDFVAFIGFLFLFIFYLISRVFSHPRYKKRLVIT
jgi:hypothetical protein